MFFFVYECIISTLGAHHVHVAAPRSQKRFNITRYWSYQWLWAALWVLGIKPKTLQKQHMLLGTGPTLQVLISIFNTFDRKLIMSGNTNLAACHERLPLILICCQLLRVFSQPLTAHYEKFEDTDNIIHWQICLVFYLLMKITLCFPFINQDI